MVTAQTFQIMFDNSQSEIYTNGKFTPRNITMFCDY